MVTLINASSGQSFLKDRETPVWVPERLTRPVAPTKPPRDENDGESEEDVPSPDADTATGPAAPSDDSPGEDPLEHGPRLAISPASD